MKNKITVKTYTYISFKNKRLLKCTKKEEKKSLSKNNCDTILIKAEDSNIKIFSQYCYL